MRSRLPASSPLRVSICSAPPADGRLSMIVIWHAGHLLEGPNRSGVNGWPPGSLRLLRRLSAAGLCPAGKGHTPHLFLRLSGHCASGHCVRLLTQQAATTGVAGRAWRTRTWVSRRA